MNVFLLHLAAPQVARLARAGGAPLAPPRNLALIAGALERSGHHPRVLDARLNRHSPRRIARAIHRFLPELLILSTEGQAGGPYPGPCSNYLPGLLRTLKKTLPQGLQVLLIGPHGSHYPWLALENLPLVDFVAKGEPVNQAVALVEALENDEPPRFQGICSLTAKGQPIEGSLPCKPLKPEPAYHLFPMHRYRDLGAPLERFAALPLCQAGRARPIKRVMEEIETLIRRFAIDRLLFTDYHQPAAKDSIESLLDRLTRQRLPLIWRCHIYPDRVHGVSLIPMAKAGCRRIDLLLPSGGHHLEEVKAWLRKGEEAGIWVQPSVRFSLPEESLEAALDLQRRFTQNGAWLETRLTLPFPDWLGYEIGAPRVKLAMMAHAMAQGNQRLTGNPLPFFKQVKRAIRKRLPRFRMALKRLSGE